MDIEERLDILSSKYQKNITRTQFNESQLKSDEFIPTRLQPTMGPTK